jgi:head-tail adaptor
MESGKLRHRAFLQSDAGTADTQSGATTESWQNVRGQFVGLEFSGGGEDVQQEQVTGVANVKVTCRYSSDITTNKRWLIPRNSSTVSAIANAGVTSITVGIANLVPNARFNVLRVDDEFLIVTAGYGTTSLTVTRGAFGSTAAAHSAGVAIARYSIVQILGVTDSINLKTMLECDCKEVYV